MLRIVRAIKTKLDSVTPSGSSSVLRPRHISNVISYHGLEPRNLLAGITFDGGTGVVTVMGSAINDVSAVTSNAITGQTTVTLNDASQSFGTTTVSSIVFQGLAGDDQFTNSSEIDSTATGGLGNDTLTGGSGVDSFSGDAGSDVIRGNGGDDRLEGGDDPDQIFGGDGDDTILGGGGEDLIQGNDGNDTLTGDDGFDRIFGGEGNDDLFGNEGNDFLAGGDGNNEIIGGEGDDLLFGGDGIDRLSGGNGNDRLVGFGEADQLEGDAGNDFVNGGDGNDFVFGSTGNDRLLGGNGNDQLIGDSGNDRLLGGTGNDRISGGAGNDLINAGGGDDDVFAGDDDDIVFGGAGDDELNGQNGDDRLLGQAGNDLIRGGTGTDLLNGSTGDDDLYGERGLDRLFGGAGNDGLVGGIRTGDVLDGGGGLDRFLTIGGDRIAFFQRGDVELEFRDASSNWTDLEIETLDRAFSKMVARTGNTQLLVDNFTDEPIVFIKENTVVSRNNISDISLVTISEASVNAAGTITQSTKLERQYRIGDFNEQNESVRARFTAEIPREIGLTWASTNSIFQRLPAEAVVFSQFIRVSDWLPARTEDGRSIVNPDSRFYELSEDNQWYVLINTEFADDLGRVNPSQDFAGVWRLAFDEGPAAEAARIEIREKSELLNDLFNAVAQL